MSSLAHRAPSGSSPRSARDDGLPDVTFRAPPLRATVRTRGHILRTKRVRFIPLVRYVRVKRGEICFAGHDAMTGAVRASLTGARAGVDRSFPYMPVLALPKHLPSGIGADLFRTQVVATVPLSGEIRSESGEVGNAREGALANAVGAARAIHSVGDCCLPAMAAPTGPPNPLRCARADGARHQLAVALVVPLGREVGVQCGEVGLARSGATAATIGTARTVPRSVIDGGHPVMSPAAKPSDAAVGPGANVVGITRICASSPIPFHREIRELGAEVSLAGPGGQTRAVWAAGLRSHIWSGLPRVARIAQPPCLHRGA